MDASRRCTACGEVKPLTEFHRHIQNGVRPRCKPCRSAEKKTNYNKEYHRQYHLVNRHDRLLKMKSYRIENKEKIKESNKRWRIANPDYWRRTMLPRVYKISLDKWNELFAAQNYACAICQQKEPNTKFKWHTDHLDTPTGPHVRGILCHHCNTGLGAFRHDPDLLRKAAVYL